MFKERWYFVIEEQPATIAGAAKRFTLLMYGRNRESAFNQAQIARKSARTDAHIWVAMWDLLDGWYALFEVTKPDGAATSVLSFENRKIRDMGQYFRDRIKDCISDSVLSRNTESEVERLKGGL